jgi:hypothetical protein
MKKSLIALAVSAAVAVPGIAAADSATVTGDARFRMHQKTVDDTSVVLNESSSNSRVRIKVNAKGEGYYVKSRFSTADGTAGGSRKVGTDYGFLGVNLGPATVEGGRIYDNWGNRFRSWDEDWDGVQALFKAGDMDIALWRSTDSEGGAFSTDLTTATDIGFDPFKNFKTGTYNVDADDRDITSLGLDVTGKAGMGNFGLRYISTTSEKGNEPNDGSGSEIDLFYNGKVGPGMLLASYVSQSGDLNEDPDGDSPMGLYVHWIQKFGAIKGEVGFVQANNYFTADDHFALFSTVGTSQDTAVMNFGGMKNSQVIAVKGTMGVAAGTNVTLGLGSFSGKIADGADSGTGTAIDLVLMHKVSKGTKVYATYGTVNMSEELGDLKYTSMGAAMETKF